ncbi:MAG: hypothetical protein HN675_00015 [Opitutae bacterium]|nr:hypothetical protein [Opitutae bacterium]MBT7851676.1 hypothetical protein [Opitutae bacterium]
MEIWIKRDGNGFGPYTLTEELGPYSLEDVEALLSSGELELEDGAWFDGCDDYLIVGDIPDLTLPAKVNRKKPSRKRAAIIIALVLVACVIILITAFLSGWVGKKTAEQKLKGSVGLVAKAEYASEIQVRGNLGYLPNEDNPHTGWIKKLYDGGEQVKFLLQLTDGKPTELRAWYKNGNPCGICGLSTKADTLGDVLEAITAIKVPDENLTGEFNQFLHGNVVCWYKNGQRSRESQCRDGKKDGPYTSWHENGQKFMEGTFKDGKLDGGQRTWWHENGQREVEYREDGLYTEWYENGQKKEEGRYSLYRDGKLLPQQQQVRDGLWIKYNEDGMEKARTNYRNGLMNGQYIEWHDTGQKRFKGTYKNGEEDGLRISYNEDGMEESRTHFKDGVEVQE